MSSNYLFLVSIVEKFGLVAFITSSVFGSILIFLTLFGVRRIFGTYKYLMVAFTSLGMLLSAMESVFHINLHLFNSGLMYFTLSPVFYSNTLMLVILSAYAGLYSSTISLIAVQFLYRYWALFSLRFLVYFRGWKAIIWVFYCLFFGGIWSFSAYFLIQMDENSEEYFKEEMLFRYNTSITDIPILTIIPIDPKNGNVRWMNVAYVLIITGIMNTQYAIMICCGWKMYSKMEEKLEHFSSALKHHHRQLFRTLVLQITTPTFFLFTPLIIVSYLPFFRFEFSLPASVAFCAISFFPVMDSIIVLIVVSEYKFAAIRIWNSLKKGKPIKATRPSHASNPTSRFSVSVV